MMKQCKIFFLLAIISLPGYAQSLYKSDRFDVNRNGVVQGDYKATVISASEMVSNYRNVNNMERPGDFSFRFLINGEDVEFVAGENHILSIIPKDGVFETPVLKFGVPSIEVVDDCKLMPANTKVVFRLDMRDAQKNIRERRVHVTNTGAFIHYLSSIHVVSDFRPMINKNFQQLQRRKEFLLSDEDEDGIYECSILLSEWEANKQENKQWKLATDISQYPQLTTDIPLVDALYNMSLEEMHNNIEKDGTLRTGALWGGVWTRDVSYSIYLGFAGINTEAAKKSLKAKVTHHNRIVQDTGSGGAWPVSTDRVVWSLAAWEVYKVTQDKEWLSYASEIIKNTLEDDLKIAYNKQYGLIMGESSFIDWRAEQSYPSWINCVGIYESMNLGTNVIHYKTYTILAEMLNILEQDSSAYTQLAGNLKEMINRHLWLPEHGYYAQYIYGDVYKNSAPRYECLGEAMAVLFDVADANRAKEIMTKSPVTPYGATIVYPQMPYIPPYHNNAIWPFVQSYWNMAAAKVGNEKLVEHGLAAVYRPAALFLSNYENLVAESGDFKGTEINSHRMLWSIAGNLSSVYRIFFGMNFEADHLRFAPCIPQSYTGKKVLKNYPYAQAKLNITIAGHGNKIKSFKLNGKKQADAVVPANLVGVQNIEIELVSSGNKDTFNLVENYTSPLAPIVKRNSDAQSIYWSPIPRAVEYIIYCNGKELSRTKGLLTSIEEAEGYKEYQVKAIDRNGVESYLSNPIALYPQKNIWIVEAESFGTRSFLPLINYSGNGFVESTQKLNNSISTEIDVPADGKYAFSVRYSNGEGPINTENKCALRSLFVNKQYEASIVMPQRGINKWSDWGMSNIIILDMKRGRNVLSISYEEHNENMNVEINRAMLDYIQLIKL